MRVALVGASITAVVAVGAAAAAITGPNFSGNGGETLPPFRVAKPSTLFWTNSGAIFQIFPSGGSVNGTVNSSGSRGWTYLPTGRYELQVNAIGSWTIRVRTGIVAPQHVRGGLLAYGGNGGLTLPPFRTRHGTTLRWKSSGTLFQIFADELNGSVNSQAHSGTTYLDAGVHHFQVNTIGAWSIAWRP